MMFKYILHGDFLGGYHVGIIRRNIAQNIGNFTHEILAELNSAIDDEFENHNLRHLMAQLGKWLIAPSSYSRILHLNLTSCIQHRHLYS